MSGQIAIIRNFEPEQGGTADQTVTMTKMQSGDCQISQPGRLSLSRAELATYIGDLQHLLRSMDADNPNAVMW